MPLFLLLRSAEVRPIVVSPYRNRRIFCDLRFAADGTLTGYLGREIVTDAFFPGGRPFVRRKGRLSWLSTDGYECGVAEGFRRGRVVGWARDKKGTWPVEWSPDTLGRWTTGPRRLGSTSCRDVVLSRSGAFYAFVGKELLGLDAPLRRPLPDERFWPVGIDRRGQIYGNVEGWGLNSSAMTGSPSGGFVRLPAIGQPSRVNDVDRDGLAVGYVRYNKDEEDGMSQPPRAVVWQEGQLRTLLALGSSGDALAIGENGDIVGWYEEGGHRRACRWRGGRCFALSVPVAFDRNAYAVAVDRRGTVAVVAEDEEGRKLYLVPSS